MKIAILSDTHDHIPNLRAAISRCNHENAALLIHCGDLISPFMLEELARFSGSAHLVFGNNAGDQYLITHMCAMRFENITHHGVLGMVTADGLRIAFTHYPEFARGLAAGAGFDVVCCGHNHMHGMERVHNTTLVNAGELLGKDDQPGFYLFDSGSLTFSRIEVGGRIALEK